MTTNAPADAAEADAATDTDAAQQTPATPTVPETDWQAEAAKWKSLARKHEANGKKWEQQEEANKSELQRAAERAAEAEARVSEFEARALRAEVAAAKGVPANLLTASTEEELTAQADALLAFRGPGAEAPAEPQAPGRVADPAQRGTPATDEQSAKEAFARQLFQV